MNMEELRSRLKERGLKVTPQRIAVYEALVSRINHPSACKVAEQVRKQHPNIATGTVYKVLETFVQNGLIKRVKTDKDIMRYDPVTDNHHHIYCEESERIIDYFDPDLDAVLKQYFEKKKLKEFKISEIRTQIIGKFNDNPD